MSMISSAIFYPDRMHVYIQTGRFLLNYNYNINLLHNAKEIKTGIEPSETLPVGRKLQWKHWKSINRLCTGYGQAAALMQNWGYSDNQRCTCGELQKMQYLFECAQLDQKCAVEDIHAANNLALDIALYLPKNI